MILKKSLLILVMSCVLASAGAATLDNDKSKFSYAVGVQIAMSLRQDGPHFDVDALTQAIRDVLSGGQLKLTPAEMQQAFNAFQQKLKAERQKLAQANARKGQEFLAANKKRKGVHTLPSGIQYEVIKAGKGDRPNLTDSVKVNYRGTLVDGTEFDSSYKRGEPATFTVNSVIQGWQEVLPLMPVGSHWKVVIPSDLAYGERGAGGRIGPNETLVFDIELLAIN
ncbi:MAG TPA: FKBP-type peptidyl-prolyl cis-trans isomerase [Gammaproteobacteria bacterium]|nr:FKBP-type peptidyl-prolyl cis-trans isomerase [Gammaproteobacteria bacterium]